MINNIKKLFRKILKINNELTYEEEQELVKEIYKKIKESL